MQIPEDSEYALDQYPGSTPKATSLPVLEFPVLEFTVLVFPALELQVLEFEVLGFPSLESLFPSSYPRTI
ncbi:hypothetical protein PG987_003125 [Apiospora arundinis]|uniref:Uncharacterized protein n=1 Tax=Apiospora arundinis TaxID=335852 RepID=A0ABR2HZP8_9PEZI